MNPDEIQLLLETFHHTLNELNTLLNLLQLENQALVDRHVDHIKSVAEKKQRSVTRIDHLTSVQSQLLKIDQHASLETGLKRLFEQFDANDSAFYELKSYQEEIRRSLAACKVLNERNGVHVAIMSRHTSRAIDLLRNPGNQPCTYGPDGNTQKISISNSRISV
jgi:flagellar biosynthesis protein FlgN